MERPVCIALRSREGEMHYDGVLARGDDGWTLRYCEGEGMDGTQCELSVRGDEITLARRGAVRMTLRFVPGQTHETVYASACGSFPLRCTTELARAELGDTGGHIALRYRLDFGGGSDEHRLFLRIKPRVEV